MESEAQRTNIVLQSIKDALVEMLLKLQEVDEMTAEIQAKRRAAKPLSVPLPDLISGNISTEQIVKMLEEKVKVGMIASGQLGDGFDSGLSEDEEEVEAKLIELPKEDLAEPSEMTERPKTPSVMSFAIDEKPSAYPTVYSSLITGRSTGLVSASPGAGGGKLLNKNQIKSLGYSFLFLSFRMNFQAPDLKRKQMFQADLFLNDKQILFWMLNLVESLDRQRKQDGNKNLITNKVMSARISRGDNFYIKILFLPAFHPQTMTRVCK